jgi:hypothetical protein
MYKFNNGIVVYTKDDRDAFLKAGYKLLNKFKDELINGESNKETKGILSMLTEETINENDNNNGVIEEEFGGSKKTNSKIQR